MEVLEHEQTFSQISGSRSDQTAAEKRSVFTFGVGIMLLTTVPYLLGFGSEGNDWIFSGFVFGVEDGNAYIARMLRGWAGDWLFNTPYTAYPQKGLLFYLPYIVLGKISSPPALHLQLASVFHIFRIISGFILVTASYDFIARFIDNRRLRIFSLVLVILGGGLGWMLILADQYNWLGSLPLDFISPEAFGFLMIFGLPHLAVARAFLLWSILAYLDLVSTQEGAADSDSRNQRSHWHKSARLSILWFLAGLFNPIDLLITGAVIVVHLVGCWLHGYLKRDSDINWIESIRLIAFAAILPSIMLAYYFAIAIWDPFARVWSAQNQLPSPNGVHFLIAYGLLLPYALIGTIRFLRKSFELVWLLLGWVMTAALLVYFPISFQRRLIDGVFVVLVILAVAAFDKSDSTKLFSMGKQSIWVWFPFSLAFITTLVILGGGLLAAIHPQTPIFIPADQAKVIQELQNKSELGSPVLASFETGNIIPAFAPVQVLIGHGPESIYQSELLPSVENFYQSNTSDSDRTELIRRFGIRYVFWGPAERVIGDWQPADATFLKEFAQSGDYSIYQVIQSYP